LPVLLFYLKDIARVELGKFNYSGMSFVDKQRAAYMMNTRLREAILLMSPKVLQCVGQLSKSFPNDVAYSVPFESVTVVKESISEVVKTLL